MFPGQRAGDERSLVEKKEKGEYKEASMIGPRQNANNFHKKRRKQLVLIVQNHFQIWNFSKHAISTCLTEVDGPK